MFIFLFFIGFYGLLCADVLLTMENTKNMAKMAKPISYSTASMLV